MQPRVKILILSLIFSLLMLSPLCLHLSYTRTQNGNIPPGIDDPRLWQKAVKIHEEAIVIDTHVDTPLPMLYHDRDIGLRSDKGNLDLIRMKEGGLDAAFFAVFTSNREDEKQPSKKALEIIDEIYRQVEKYPDLATMAFSSQDIREIHRTGKRAILLGMENGAPVEGSLRLLRDFYRLGIRYITLTHTGNNDITDSSTADAPKWNGLSDLGRDVVREMNRLGMIVDVSHLSDKAVLDVLAVSSAPVMASHSSVRALCNTPRNVSDELIKAIAAKKGVIQINFFGNYLSDDVSKRSDEVEKMLEPEFQKLREKYKDDRAKYWAEASALYDKHAPPPPKIDLIIDHIDYIVKLAGPDFVGFGSDFDGAGNYPEGMQDVTGYPLITYHLLKRGYSEENIRKILGGNFLRVFDEVMRRAAGQKTN